MIINLIKNIQRHTTSTNVSHRVLANYILDNIDDVINMSAAEVAQLAHSSPSSLVRFCKTLDLDGWSQLKNDLKKYQYLYSSKKNVLNISLDSTDRFEWEKHYMEIVSKTQNKLYEDFIVNPEVIDAIIPELHKAKRIYIFNFAISHEMSRLFVNRLSLNQKDVILSNDINLIQDYMMQIDSDDFVIVSSLGPKNDMIKTIIEALNENVKTLAIYCVPQKWISRVNHRVELPNYEAELWDLYSIRCISYVMFLDFLISKYIFKFCKKDDKI